MLLWIRNWIERYAHSKVVRSIEREQMLCSHKSKNDGFSYWVKTCKVPMRGASELSAVCSKCRKTWRGVAWADLK